MGGMVLIANVDNLQKVCYNVCTNADGLKRESERIMKKIISMFLVFVLIFCCIGLFSSCGFNIKGAQGEQGIQGEKGEDGRGILKIEIIDGCLWITYTDDPDHPVNVGSVLNENSTSSDDITFMQITKTADAIRSGQLVLVNNDNRYTFPAAVSLLRIYDNMVTKQNGGTIYRPVSTDYKLEAEALQALNNMMYKHYEYDDAATFAISSAYRTLEDQANLNSSVLPGYSDHHTGYCVAIQYSDRSNLENDHWIYQNAHKFGFVVRYPEGKEGTTGVSDYKHCLRYVGVAHATYMYQNDLCMEEYLDLLKNNYNSSTKRLTISAADGFSYEVYYIAASGDQVTTFDVPSNYQYTVSGDNRSGFIVTIKK